MKSSRQRHYPIWGEGNLLRSYAAYQAGDDQVAGGVHDERYRALIQQLKNARTALGLSQEAVARSFGKRQQFVSKYESGERRLDVIEFIDVAHQLHFDWQRALTKALGGD